MESLLVSACLLGFECKYSGGSNKLTEAELSALRGRYRLIPVCPESAGGLPTPRSPSEIRGQSVVSCEGRAVRDAARLAIGQTVDIRLAQGRARARVEHTEED